MPLLRFDVQAEITGPLPLPGSPDVQGELTLYVPAATIRDGSGPLEVEGFVTCALVNERVDLPRTAVQVKYRTAVIEIKSSRAAGELTLAVWSSWKTIEGAAKLVPSTGILKGQTVTASGKASMIKAEAWEPTTLPTVPTSPGQTPSLTHFWPRIAMPLFTYSWPVLWAKLPAMLAGVAAECDRLGIDRGEIAFTVETHSDGGRPGAPVTSWKLHWSERVSKIPELQALLAAHGFGLAWYCWNTNTPGKGYAKTWNKRDVSGNLAAILEPLEPVLRRIDWSRCWDSLANENDSTTPESILRALRGLGDRFKIPAAVRMASEEPMLGAQWLDRHVGDMDKLPTVGKNTVITTDNPGSIRQLQGNTDIWNGVGKVNVGAYLKGIEKYVPSGVPLFFYNLTLTDIWTPYVAQWRQILTRYAELRRGAAPVPGPAPSAGDPAAPASFDLAKVKFQGANISAWPITFALSDVKIGASEVTFTTTPAQWGATWPGYTVNKLVHGNPWCFAFRDGAWQACTWEWIRAGVHDRETAKLRACFGGLKSGEPIAICISGLARNAQRNVSERSNLVWITAP